MCPLVGIGGGDNIFLSSSSVVPGVGFDCRQFGVLMEILSLN